MKKWLLVLVLLALVVVPASATLINTTVIADAKTTAATNDITFGGWHVPTFVKNIPAGYGLQDIRVYVANPNDPLHLTFTQTNNNVITATIDKIPATAFTEIVTVSLSGGTSIVDTYTTFYAFSLAPTYRCFYVQTNDTPKTYYFVITNSNRMTFQDDYPFDLDTTKDSYLVLSQRPSLNPIKSFSISSTTGQDVNGVYSYGTIINLQASEEHPGSGYDSGILGVWERLVNAVTITYDAISKFATGVATFFILLQTGVLFFFAGEVLLTIIAAYTIINAILSIHDSDDLFRSISKFMKREMKLFKFFMEIFTWIKDLIKWW